MGSTREIAKPNYSSSQAQHYQDSPVSETKEGNPPEEPEVGTPRETGDKPPRP